MLFLCALTISVKAQSPTQNYVLTKDVLDVDGTHAITTVTYYDGLNRLEESTYAEGADMSQNKNRYSENVLSYSANGSIAIWQEEQWGIWSHRRLDVLL